MKKVLLGSTALVAAGLMAGPAFAQLELSISGSVDVHMGFASEKLDTDRRGYGITTDTTLNFNSDGVADNGLEYGTRINVDDDGDAFKIDETYVLIRGTFGEFRLGADDPAASTLRFTIPTVGNGQADGDFGRYVNPKTQDGVTNGTTGFVFGTDFGYSSDDNKIIYIGTFGDFQVGASYSPTTDAVADDPGQANNDGDGEDILSLAGNWRADFGNTSVGISGGYNRWDWEGDPTKAVGDFDKSQEYGIAGEVGFGAFLLGGLYIKNDTKLVGGGEAELTRYGLGASFTTGPWGFALNALGAEAKTGGTKITEDIVYGAGVEYTLADGLTPYADIVAFDNDVAGTVNDNDGTVFLFGVTASF